MASCPNCGFDLNSEGNCTVCGYGTAVKKEAETVGAARESQQSGGAARKPLSDGTRTPGSGPSSGGARKVASNRLPIILGIAAVVVILVVGAFVVLRHPTSASAQVAQSSVPAATGQESQQATPEAQPTGTTPSDTTVESKTAVSTSGAAASTTIENAAKSGSAEPTSTTQSGPRTGFSAPVGASPESIRATHPIDLYNPSTEPVYDITKRTEFPPLTSEDAYVSWMLAHTNQQEKFLRERWVRAQKTVERHLVIHRSVLMGFLLTPREWFARPYNLSKVYENTALPIGYGQTISGPDLVAHMTDALDPQPDQKILEIGTGSGFQSAFLSQLSNFVYTIEIVRPLAEETNQIYVEHTKEMPEFANIHRRLADGYYGWSAYAPFDRIIVTTGIDHIPPDLLKELKPGGIMVIPIGPPSGQTILKITKTVDKEGNVHLTREDIYHGIRDIFVPFTASGGGTHDIGNSGTTK